MQVAGGGNSLAFRLAASVVEALEPNEGDEVAMQVAKARSFGVAREASGEDLLDTLRAFRGRLPADSKFDRDEANTR